MVMYARAECCYAVLAPTIPAIDQLVALRPATVEVRDATTGGVIGRGWDKADEELSINVAVVDATDRALLYYALPAIPPESETGVVEIQLPISSHYIVKV